MSSDSIGRYSFECDSNDTYCLTLLPFVLVIASPKPPTTTEATTSSTTPRDLCARKYQVSEKKTWKIMKGVQSKQICKNLLIFLKGRFWWEVKGSGMFSSVQSLDLLDCRGNMRDDSAEILFPSVLRKPIVISAGRKRNTITFFFQGKKSTLYMLLSQ